MLDKVATIEKRYEELGKLLEEASDDYQKAAEIAKERSDLEPVVQKAQDYRTVTQQVAEARSLQETDDPELRELALADLEDFWSLLGNPYLWTQFPHTVLSGFATAAFFVMGISAYHLIRRRDVDFFRRSFNIAAVYGLVAIFLVILVGHSQAQRMVQVQPMKMAAAEALWESEDPASFSLFTVGDEKNRSDVFAIRIPTLLSVLSYNQPAGEVKGIRNLQEEYEQQYGPGNYVPSVITAYWSFRIMVGAGFAMMLLAALALYPTLRSRPIGQMRYIWLFPWAISLPYLANSAGWIFTEMGRQPWVVYGLMKTENAFSPNVTAGMVLLTLVVFTLVYAGLMVADVYLLVKFAKAGPQGSEHKNGNGNGHKPALEDQPFVEVVKPAGR